MLTGTVYVKLRHDTPIRRLVLEFKVSLSLPLPLILWHAILSLSLSRSLSISISVCSIPSSSRDCVIYQRQAYEQSVHPHEKFPRQTVYWDKTVLLAGAIVRQTVVRSLSLSLSLCSHSRSLFLSL